MRSLPVVKTPALPCSLCDQLLPWSRRVVGLVVLDLEVLLEPGDDLGEDGAGDEDAGFVHGSL